MNFQHLKYIVEVDRVSSISKAAKNLYMGQPNLSKAIKDLEKEIGITIFRRTSKGVEATKSGREFLSHANAILMQLDELQELYQNDADDTTIKMKVAMPRASYVSNAFSNFVNQFHGQKKMDISIKELSPMDTIMDVAHGESHVGVVRFQEKHESYFHNILIERDIKWEPLLEFQMVLLMAKNHKLANLKTVPYHLLDGCIEVVHGDYQLPNLQYTEISSEKKESDKKKIYVYDRGSQFDLLKAVEGSYMWVSRVPFELSTQNGLVQKPCSAGGFCKDVIIYKDKAMVNKYEKMFIEELKESLLYETI